METLLAAADWQIPYQDGAMQATFLHVVAAVQPNVIVLGGDLLDFPYLTTKFITPSFPKQQLLDDLAHVGLLIAELNTIAPAAKIVWIEGNHEARLSSLILERAPALQALLGTDKALSVPKLVDPSNLLNFKYVGPYDSVFPWSRLIFKHGEKAGPQPATSELKMEGSSGVSFHVHRFDSSIQTDRSGAHGWWTIGCMCQTSGPERPPSNHKGHNRFENWQQGFVMVEATSKQYAVTPLIATEQKVILGGQLYGPAG